MKTYALCKEPRTTFAESLRTGLCYMTVIDIVFRYVEMKKVYPRNDRN